MSVTALASGPLSAAVIGGGWAGCAAAFELLRMGHKVTLFEAARTLGGRARMVELDGRLLDNGQHILLGAYSATLSLMRQLGMDERDAFLRLPLQIPYAPACGGMQFIAPRLPAPLHGLVALLRASGLATADKLAIARFQSTARWMDWMLYQDCSVSELLERYDQTETVIRLLWRPLCIAALNTPPERASAQVFLNVLKDSLGASRAASDMLIPRQHLSALLPDRVADHLERHGCPVHAGMRVQSLRRSAQGWAIETGNSTLHAADAVVLATAPNHAAALLAELAPQAIPAFDYEPISTCYLQYAAELALPRPFLALTDDAEARNWGQFVFDRGQLDAANAGLLAVVVSASESALDESVDLAGDISRQLAQACKMPHLAHPLWSRVITEKRATFSCRPGLDRPANQTSLPGLWLAGDYTQGPYPATIEAAVRSGMAAAAGIHQSSSRTRASA